MANGLKYGTKSIGALKFDEPIVETVLVPIMVSSSEYNFLTDWIVNSEQPVGGIEVTAHTIKIKKFKPNTWIIKSAYNDIATESGFLNKFYGKQWTFTNLAENNSILSSGDSSIASNWAHYPSNYNVIGFVLTPIKNDNTLANAAGALNWPIAEGCFKDVAGAAQYGFPNNGTKTLYACSWYFENVDQATPSTLYSCSNGYNDQMALAIYSSADTDNDGNINVQTYNSLADPTTIEGFRATVGENAVYTKAKTYANIIQAYNLESEEHNSFIRTVNGSNISILSKWNGVSTAFVVDERNYNGIYSHIRLPEITDLASLISRSYPIKFWGNIEQDGVHPTFWTSIQNAFATTQITDGNFGQCLFANSKTNTPIPITLNIDLDNPEEYINIGDIFAESSAFSEIHFVLGDGVLKSLHECFLHTQNLNAVTFNNVVRIVDFSGTFEGTSLMAFPTNVGAGNDWQTQLSEPTCLLNFAADNARLTTFGIIDSSSELGRYEINVNPYCSGAFARSDIQTIEYILDMKFVEPISGAVNYDGTLFNSMFGDNSALVSANIRNLNKGDWRLDGTASNGNYAGNLVNLNATSVNYMLNNVFDLRRNSSETSYFENEFNSLNGWTASSGTKRPIFFEGWETCTLTKNLSTSGTMNVVLSLVNCTMSITNGGSTRNIDAGTTELELVSGPTTITFTKTNAQQEMIAGLFLSEHFRSELTPNLNSANIYLPANAGSKIDSSALSTANTRGWTVYVGGTIYTG